MGLEVMKAKRALHDEILQKNEARRKERENDGASGSTFSSSLFDHLGSHKRKISDEADQKDIEVRFIFLKFVNPLLYLLYFI